jgi:hypothetical protein
MHKTWGQRVAKAWGSLWANTATYPHTQCGRLSPVGKPSGFYPTMPVVSPTVFHGISGQFVSVSVRFLPTIPNTYKNNNILNKLLFIINRSA